jgi:hypothetical protein
VKGRRFFPLDKKLALREDHWSEGAARVIARHGLKESSFESAAEAYTEGTGGSISGSSVRRITQGFGKQLAAAKEQEAERAMEMGPFEESPRERWIGLEDPIQGVGNVSSDGTMILIRGEGWKEVKMAAFSQVEVLGPDNDKRRRAQREGKRKQEDVVRLSRHSYYAGLWDADTFGAYQYAEGLRRGFDLVERRSSVNDGAPWIERITGTNFPGVTQIVDWGHSTRRLWAVAHAVHGEGKPEAAGWVERRKDELWAGRVEPVIRELKALRLDRSGYSDEVRQAPGYFHNNRKRMRYDEFRAAGYPIGSGTVESGARNVIQPRMRRPGRGWKRENAQAMLAALGEVHSGRLRWAWQQAYHPETQGSPIF